MQAEMHDWKALSEQTPAPGSKETATFYTYWGQGLAAGHLRDAKLAAAALKGFDASLEAMKKTPMADAVSELEPRRNEILGWQAFAEGHPDTAVVAMHKAADQQDKLGQSEVDIPAREMLGDLLLLENKPTEAQTEYRVALTLSPNRLNGLLSAGEAAERAKRPEEARGFYSAAAKQTNEGAHTERPEVAHAVKMADATVADLH